MTSLDVEFGCAGGYHGAQGCCRRCTCDFSLNNACPVHGMWKEYQMPETTTTEAQAGTIIGQFPASSVVLLDMPWFEVGLGDCVLHGGSWVLLEAMWPATDDAQWLGITIRYGGESRHCQVQAGRATVVKRYITEG